VVDHARSSLNRLERALRDLNVRFVPKADSCSAAIVKIRRATTGASIRPGHKHRAACCGAVIVYSHDVPSGSSSTRSALCIAKKYCGTDCPSRQLSRPRNSSGSLAMFAAIRRASCLLSNLAHDRNVFVTVETQLINRAQKPRQFGDIRRRAPHYYCARLDSSTIRANKKLRPAAGQSTMKSGTGRSGTEG